MEFPLKGYWIDAHFFRLSMNCQAKLRHFLDDLPVSEKSLETIPFHHVSQRLLRNLLRMLKAPFADFCSKESPEIATEQTRAWIYDPESSSRLFDAMTIFDDRYIAKSVMLYKNEGKVCIYHVDAKAISMGKSHVEFDPRYSGNWVRRMQKAFFTQWVFERSFKDINFESYILFPKKQVHVGVEGLSEILYSANREALIEEALRWNRLPNIGHYFVEFRVDNAFEGPFLGFKESTSTDANELMEKQLSKIDFIMRSESVESPIGMRCKDCEYRLDASEDLSKSGFLRCWSDKLVSAQDSMVFDLVGTSGREYLEQNIYTQKEVPIDTEVDWIELIRLKKQPINLEDRRNLQIAKAQGLGVPKEIIQPVLFDKIKAWKYPLYFLDFETITLSVANHPSGRPYHTYVPQYSIHKLSENGQLEHFHWMSGRLDLFSDIRLLLSMHDILMEEEGTLIHFSPTEQVLLKGMKRFMRGRKDVLAEDKKKIADMLTVYAKNRSMIDIKLLIEQHYYNHFMGGSLSLKSIYDAFCQYTDTKNLFHDLQEGHVRNGNDALNTLFAYYCDLNISEDEREELRQELLNYCAIDTLSMVQMVQYFKTHPGSTKF